MIVEACVILSHLRRRYQGQIRHTRNLSEETFVKKSGEGAREHERVFRSVCTCDHSARERKGMRVG